MTAIKDMGLWNFVKSKIRPLGSKAPQRAASLPMSLARAPVPPSIDLHGRTVQDAYDTVRTYVAAALAAGHENVVVVTGRSGTIRAEFPHWAEKLPGVRRAEVLPGDGAFRLKLRR
jgi:DNA-nicking Smr family endonuclease